MPNRMRERNANPMFGAIGAEDPGVARVRDEIAQPSAHTIRLSALAMAIESFDRAGLVEFVDDGMLMRRAATFEKFLNGKMDA